MTVLKLNDNGIWLFATILSIIDLLLISNFCKNNIALIITIPLLISINLLITSNIKIIDIKKELAHRSK